MPEHELFGSCKYGLYPALGLLYIASALEEKGIPVRIVDAIAPPRRMSELLEILMEEKPTVIGISATSMQIRGAVQLASRLKEVFGNRVAICIGGNHVTVDPDFINRFPLFDFSVCGEGEITFPRLVNKIISGEEKIKGVFYGEPPMNLDRLPFPSRHLIDKRDYSEAEEGVAIQATRGCPFNCVFCCSLVMGRRVRFRSPKNVVDEMEMIGEDYHERFRFVDDTLTINKHHTLQLCTEMISRDINAKWSCSTRADCVDKYLLETMYKAGCEYIAFGVESGSERIRNEIVKKHLGDKDLSTAFRLCKEVGIETGCYLMMGFPNETKIELCQTANIGIELDASIIGVHLTQLMPGTELFAISVREGLVPHNIFDAYAKGELKAWPIYVPRTMSLNDMIKARRDAYRRFYFRPKVMLHRIGKDFKSMKALTGDIQMALQLFRRGASPAEPSEWNLTEDES